MTAHSAVAGVEINAKPSGRQDEILSAEALAFVAGLHRRIPGRKLGTGAAAVRRHRLQSVYLFPILTAGYEDQYRVGRVTTQI